jgi:GxxExxY protein
MEQDKLTEKIIGCAIEVHRTLGPGLMESTYENCLAHELFINNIDFKKQLALPVVYKGVNLDCGYRIDLLIKDQVIIELKSVKNLTPIDAAQILTYMKLANKKTGLLINFNVNRLVNGIKRFKL